MSEQNAVVNDPSYQHAVDLIANAHAGGTDTLSLRGLRLDTLPPDIDSLRGLKVLDLGFNNLRALPDWLGNLTGLQSLDLSDNGLRTLPDWLGNLTSLQSLDLSDNGLSTLPDWLGSLATLEAGARDFLGMGLDVTNNPLPPPYPALIAPGQPKATANVLAYLRGEVDPATLPETQDHEDADEAAEDLEQVTEQRPAAYRFGLRDGRIDAVPEPAEPIDPEVAADLLTELRDKARDLDARLAAANADPRVQRSVDRLREALTGEPMRPGILLSRSRSIEADRDAFDTPEGRAELFPDAIAHMNDVLLSLQDVLAVYPVVRRIDAERLALDIQRDAASLDTIAAGTDAIAAAAAASEAVTPEAVEALVVNDAAIADAPDAVLRAGLLADKLLVVANFTRQAIRVGMRAVRAGARIAGAELADLARQVWPEVKEGSRVVGRVLPMVGLMLVVNYLAGPISAIAPFAPSGFKSLVKAIRDLERLAKSTGESGPKSRGEASSGAAERPPTGSEPPRKASVRKKEGRKKPT